MKLFEWLFGLSRPAKQLTAIAFDFLTGTITTAIALWVHFPDSSHDMASIFALSAITAGFSVLVMWFSAFYRSVIRYISLTSLLSVVLGAITTGLGSAYAADVLSLRHPIAVSLLATSLFILGIVVPRLLVRHVCMSLINASKDRQRVIIYGAGSAGVQTANALRIGNEFSPVAFIDDDPNKQGIKIEGLNVYPPEKIKAVGQALNASILVLAIPSASVTRRKEIIEMIESSGLAVKTIPGLSDIISGRSHVEEIRDVAIEELLGREPVPPLADLLEKKIRGKNVLVTGAGGSIGSELARQIIALSPRVLVLFEVSEFALYSIEKEIHAKKPKGVNVISILGSINDRELVERVIRRFAVQTIYHAAAYKHVPIVEHNILSGIRNNVFGTLNVAYAAGEANVESFILISTDKAVRPTNVMGASKRLAELVLQALDDRFPHTTYSMVRFGNVLGSSGSVVPLFKEQIAKGGPVTVTHPNVTRYFMTIPEAATLVIQAGAMAAGGDVFLLDMGEPVRILELAKRMIRLSGLSVKDEHNPDGDIEIQFSGLRPGEKLYEELLIDTQGGEKTIHPRILRAKEGNLSWKEIKSILLELQEAIKEGRPEKARGILLKTPLDFSPSSDCVDYFAASEKYRLVDKTVEMNTEAS